MKQLCWLSVLIFFSLYSYDYLPDDIPLNKVLLALSHNGSQSKAYGWRYYQQLGDVRSQWKAGSRGDKVNLHWYQDMSLKKQLVEKAEKSKIGSIIRKAKKMIGFKPQEKKPFIGLCHEPDGRSNCLLSRFEKKGKIGRAEDYFREWVTLLRENPKDIIVLILEDYTDRNSLANGTKGYTKEQIRKELDGILERSGLAQYALKLIQPVDFPTIGQMRLSGKRALIFDDNAYNASHSAYLNKNNFYATHWEFNWKEDMQKKECRMFTQGSHAPFFVIGIGPEQSIPTESKKGKVTQKVGLNSVQGHDITPTDYRQVNSLESIKSRIADCQAQVPSVPVTVIKVDFIEIGDIRNAVREINETRVKEWNRSQQAKASQ